MNGRSKVQVQYGALRVIISIHYTSTIHRKYYRYTARMLWWDKEGTMFIRFHSTPATRASLFSSRSTYRYISKIDSNFQNFNQSERVKTAPRKSRSFLIFFIKFFRRNFVKTFDCDQFSQLRFGHVMIIIYLFISFVIIHFIWVFEIFFFMVHFYLFDL